MDKVLATKIAQVKKFEDKIVQYVNLNSAIDISTEPSHPRASFPYEKYTPYEKELNQKQFQEEFLIDNISIEYNFNTPLDVSSHKDGVCYVTKFLHISNSHAGTHVDLPGHFLKNPPFNSWDKFQLNGPCVVLDLTHKKNSKIEFFDIQSACGNLDLNSISRLLINTYGNEIPDKWDSNPSYLSIECAKSLGELGNLLLIGIDTPSVDHQNASPICDCSHGGLWKGRVAIMENLNFSMMEKRNMEGFIQTILSKSQKSFDGNGCAVNFFPKQKISS